MQRRAVLFASTLLALTTACSSGGSGGPAGHVVPKSVAFKPVSCDADEVGPSALMSNAGKVEIVDSGYFGKRYNLADLRAVLKASIYSTALYGARIGATLSAVSFDAADEADARTDSAGDCYSYSFLPTASKELMDVWSGAAQGGAEMGGTLRGLYVDYRGPQIMVLRGSDRWTIVHELLHYNFDKIRQQEHAGDLNSIESQIKAAHGAFDKHMAAYQHLPNRSDLQAAADDLDAMIRFVYRQNVDSFLEEVVIEAMLIDRYMDRELSNVSRDYAKSGLWYIVKSKENAMRDFQEYEPLVAKIEREAGAHTWLEIVDAVQKDRDLISVVAARVDQISRTAEERVKVLDPNTPPPPMNDGTEVSLRLAAFVNSPAYQENKRDARALVEKYAH